MNTAPSVITNNLCMMSSATYASATVSGTAFTGTVQDLTSSSGGASAYCLATPGSAGSAATFSSVTPGAGTLSLVPGTTINPTYFPQITGLDID